MIPLCAAAKFQKRYINSCQIISEIRALSALLGSPNGTSFSLSSSTDVAEPRVGTMSKTCGLAIA